MTRAAPATHRLTRTLTVGRDREDVFAFFADPRNLERVVPGWMGLRLLSVSPEPPAAGTLIHYRLGPFGLGRGASRFVAWDPPRRFVDEQERGPFAAWRHEHAFEPAPGGTRIEDRVDYTLPFGPAGRLAHRLLVGPLLRAFFDHREARIRDLLGPAPAAAADR